MKVLIVDDEEHVREGVELAIDWPTYNIQQILTAEDGFEAIEIVRGEEPELIICDMSMPKMDGPRFLELLREEGWNSKVIVLSGYQEFRYTRATLLANGVDYLLKPFKIDDLDKAVAKAVTSIEQNQQTKHEEFNNSFRIKEADSLLNEQKMNTYLQNDPIQEDSMLQLFEEVGLSEQDFYVLMYLPRNSNSVIERYYMGDESLFEFSVKNVLNDIIKQVGNYYCFTDEQFIIVYIQSDLSIDELEFYQKKISELWYKTLRLLTISGFSKRRTSIGQLHHSLKEAKAEILNTNIIKASQSYQNATDLTPFMDKELLLLEAIRNQDKNQIQELVHSYVESLHTKSNLPLKELQHYSIEANLLLMRVMNQLQSKQHIETMPLWLSDLEEWEKTLIHMFHSIVDDANESASTIQSIAAIKNYIHDHMSEEITLSSLAEIFHFSPQYLSKRFKEMHQTTVMSYLTQIRMDNACELLKFSELSVQEIAASVGYEDDNYFGKVFRKHYGVSPTQYRRVNK